jgi:ABC-type iron transport system FetAB permease component
MALALQQSFLTISGQKLATATAIGPASATAIANATGATLTLTLQPGYFKVMNIQGVLQISGLPTGLCLNGFSVSGNSVVIVVYNSTTATITVNANSVTAIVQILGW